MTDNGIGVTDKVTDNDTGVTDKGVILSDGEKRVLDEINYNPLISYILIGQNINISKKTVADYIKHLKEKGIIERVGNNKKGYWKIKVNDIR